MRVRELRTFVIAAAVAAAATASLPSPAAAFRPDKTLAGSGIDRIPVGDRDVAAAGGVAVMPDGRTVVTGYAKQGDKVLGAILRLLPSGEPDPAFAAGTSFPGTTYVNAATAPGDAAKATVLQDGILAPDGSIFAAGRIVDRVGEYEESGQAFVTHVLPGGTVDPAFGTAGIALVNGQIAPQLLLGPDGGIFVLAGLDSPGTAAPRTAVIKLTAAGKRDSGYGVDGTAEIKAAEDYFTAAQMAVDAQGRVVVAGTVLRSSSVAPGVARLTPAGGLDASFGGTPAPGISIVAAPTVDDGQSSSKIDGLSPFVQSLSSLALAPDGKILIAGRGTTNGADVALVGRVLADGKLDSSFGQKGFARFRGQKQADRRSLNYDTALSAVVLDGSRIVVAGTQDSVQDAVQIKQPAAPNTIATKQTPDLLIAGLTAAGKLDPTAHSGGPAPGVAVYPAGAQRFSRVRRMILAGGNLVIAGRAIALASSGEREPEKNPSDFLLVRLGKGTAAPIGPGGGDPEPGGACAVPTVKVRSVVLAGCFGKAKDGVFTALSGVITMNGTRIGLLNGSRLLAKPADGTIRTATAAGGAGSARVSAAAPTGAVVQLSKGAIAFKVPPGGGGTRAVAAGPPKDPCSPIGQAIGTVPTQGVGNLLGFPLPGVAKLSVANGTTYLQVNVSLPKPAFVDATGCATLVTKAGGGLQLDSLHVAVGTATLGPLELGAVSIDYTGSEDTWKGSLQVTLPLPRELKLSGDVTFQSGDFAAANVGVEFPVAPIILPPTIALKGINAGIQIKPFTKISGGVHLIAGPSFLGTAAVDADLSGAVSFPGKPYAIAIDITGAVRVVSIPLATAQVHYDTGGTFFVKAHAGFDAFVADINVDVEGYISGPHFYIEGDARVCVVAVCAGSSALLSDVGAAACGGLVTPLKDLAIGVFIKWTSPFIPDELFFHCDLSQYRTVIKKTRLAPDTPGGPDAFTRQADAAPTVTVALGTKTLELKAGGAQTPLVTVVAPDGTRTQGPTRSYDLPLRASQVVRAQGVTIMSVRAKTASYIRIDDPAPGVWRVESQLGTAPITQLEQSFPFPAPKVKAKVGGQGRVRTVEYRYAPAPGEAISLVEQGGRLEHPLGELKRATAGHLPFAPGDGPAGRRRIVAHITQDGLPRKSIVLASYAAPGPDIPGKPRAVKLRAAGANAVVATWRAVPRAASYRVTFRLKDGHAGTVLVKARARPSARISAFLPRKGGSVTVIAVGRTALSGSKSTGILKPSASGARPVKRRG